MQNAIDKFKAEVRKELGVQSNADRIRAMDDEELADYLYKMTLASLTVVEVDSREIAIPKLLKWLQSEAE